MKIKMYLRLQSWGYKI